LVEEIGKMKERMVEQERREKERRTSVKMKRKDDIFVHSDRFT